MATVEVVGIIGAGTMGRGIAQIAAQNAGLKVVLYDVAEEILKDATGQIGHFLNRGVDKGRLSKEDAERILGLITPTMSLADFKAADCVIEAAPEVIDLKQKLFGELSDIVSDKAILATNTSTLSVTQIAAAASHPGRVVGMHFFNPPALMPLVEVIAGSETTPEVIDQTIALAQAMDKTPVRAQDVPGFIVNRVARPFYLETLRMLEQDVTDHETFDRLIREGGGFRMGPFELMDLIGLDINYAASQSVYNGYFQAARLRPSILQARMVASGRLGRKSGHGWYDYSSGKGKS